MRNVQLTHLLLCDFRHTGTIQILLQPLCGAQVAVIPKH